MILVHLSVLTTGFIKALILKCKMYRKKKKDTSRAQKIKNGSKTENTAEQATPQLKKRPQIVVASKPKPELMIIEEEDNEESKRDNEKKELIIEEEFNEAQKDVV